MRMSPFHRPFVEEVAMLKFAVTELQHVKDRIHCSREKLTNLEAPLASLRAERRDLDRRENEAEAELAAVQEALRAVREQQQREGGSEADDSEDAEEVALPSDSSARTGSGASSPQATEGPFGRSAVCTA